MSSWGHPSKGTSVNHCPARLRPPSGDCAAMEDDNGKLNLRKISGCQCPPVTMQGEINFLVEILTLVKLLVNCLMMPKNMKSLKKSTHGAFLCNTGMLTPRRAGPTLRLRLALGFPHPMLDSLPLLSRASRASLCVSHLSVSQGYSIQN